MGIYGILWVFRLGGNTYNLGFKLAILTNLFYKLSMVLIKKNLPDKLYAGFCHLNLSFL